MSDVPTNTPTKHGPSVHQVDDDWAIRAVISREEITRIAMACMEVQANIRDELATAEPYEAAQGRKILQSYQELEKRAKWWLAIIESERQGGKPI